MARAESFGRTLACRLVLLLFWTIFVCVVLYASQGNTTPGLSSNRLTAVAPARWKRISNNITSRGEGGLGQCTMDMPAQETAEMFTRTLNSRRRRLSASGNPVVYCSVASLCGRGSRTFRTDCYSSMCKVYRIRVRSWTRVVPLLSDTGLSSVVEEVLRDNSFMTVDDLNGYVSVQCEHPAVVKMELSGDILPSPQCQSSIPAVTKSSPRQLAPKKHIHLVYFRFLSHWELPLRFPGLLAMLGKWSEERGATVMKFDKYQATRWGDEDMTSLLLQGGLAPFSLEKSLLDTLRKAGYCFRMEDLACSKSQDQEALLANVTSSAGEILCRENSLRHKEAMMDMLCTDGNLTDSAACSMMTALLANVHEPEINGRKGSSSATSRPVLSFSIINTKDFKNPIVLDSVLRNFFITVLGEKDRIVIFMGGVGNPAFLRFDQNLALQSQASKPAMVLVTSANLTQTTLKDARRLSQSLFSIRDVHDFTRKLVENENKLPTSPSRGRAGPHVSSNKSPRARSSCADLGVEAPFVCLCEEQFVNYENDTLMAGFAELAVSIINSRLKLSPSASSSSSARRCATLSGVDFSNARVGRGGPQRRRILFDLVLADELYQDQVLHTVGLDMWSTDRLPQADVTLLGPRESSSHSSPSQVAHPAFRADRSLKTLCKTGQSFAFHEASEGSLVKHWSQERHFGLRATVSHVHDDCLYMFVRDFGDSLSVEAANVCRDRRYHVMLHLSLMNMMSLSPLPLSVGLGHAQREFVTVLVKISYTVPNFAYKLHPDFEVSYDD